LHLLSSHSAIASAAAAGHRSFLEGVLLPDFGGLVTDTLTASGAWELSNGDPSSAGATPPAGEASGAYFDAESVLGSMRQRIPNAVSHSCVASCTESGGVVCRSSLCSQHGGVHGHGMRCMLEADLLCVVSA
jgi:hypothetical protein